MTRSFTASTFVINVIVEQWQHAEQTANCDANNSALETHTHSALIQHYVSMTLPATCSTAAELILLHYVLGVPLSVLCQTGLVHGTTHAVVEAPHDCSLVHIITTLPPPQSCVICHLFVYILVF